MTDDPRWASFTITRAEGRWSVLPEVATGFGTRLSGRATAELFETQQDAEAWVMTAFDVDPRDWVRSDTGEWLGPISRAPGTWPAVPKSYVLVKLDDWNPELPRQVGHE